MVYGETLFASISLPVTTGSAVTEVVPVNLIAEVTAAPEPSTVLFQPE